MFTSLCVVSLNINQYSKIGVRFSCESFGFLHTPACTAQVLAAGCSTLDTQLSFSFSLLLFLETSTLRDLHPVGK